MSCLVSLAVIMGIGDILLYIRMERFIGFGPVISLISGIVSVMAGIMLVVYPGAGVMVLSVPVSYLVHRPLYFQTVPRRNDTALFRKRDVLYHF